MMLFLSLDCWTIAVLICFSSHVPQPSFLPTLGHVLLIQFTPPSILDCLSLPLPLQYCDHLLIEPLSSRSTRSSVTSITSASILSSKNVLVRKYNFQDRRIQFLRAVIGHNTIREEQVTSPSCNHRIIIVMTVTYSIRKYVIWLGSSTQLARIVECGV